MGELLATLVWVAGMYFVGRWDGNRRAEKRFMSAKTTSGAGKCRFCGVLIEGGGLDMEAHERFYCRPPSQGRGQQQQSDGR